MIFKNQQESANLLAQKIKEEVGNDLKNYLFTYIDLEDKNYCELITQELNQELKYLPDLLSKTLNIKNLIILDSGNTNGQEYNEFTDQIRKKYPEIKIIIAVPVIPESEEKLLQSNCDSLIYLHADPLFFSTHQFYESN